MMPVGGDRRPSSDRPAGGAGVRAHEFIDPAALMRIKSLQVRARVVVEGFYKGLHRSPYHGFSVEFSEYREYTPGDDPRTLDWRVFARSDRYYVKRFEDETNLRCHLVVDTSRSMGYGSGPVTKSEYARTAAATVAYFLSRQRDAVGLIAFEDRVSEYLPPRHRPGHLARMMAALQREPEGKATDFVGPLDEVAATVRRRGLFIILSDLLVPAAAVRTAIGNLRAGGHDVAVVRVLDPAERTFPFTKAAMFRDAESGRELYIDPEAAADQYRKRFAAHEAEVIRSCADFGADFEATATDRPLELVLFDLLKARMRRGNRPARRAAPGRGVAR